MSFIQWLRSLLSHRGSALAHYRAGMVKAAKHDHRGAIAEYSAAIESAATPPDVKAMATYNRALAYSAIHENDKAANDLKAVLKMPGLSDRIKEAALRRQERLRRRDGSGKQEGSHE